MENYRLIKEENIKDIQAKAMLFEHKSGAKVIYIGCGDENRVFSVCFKTMPKDNKGTAHIVEHCVLCGSEKIRIKDPFNELDKGSLNTYLNAITFHDKTLFPVASTNEKEIYNLAEVYLDGVFFPLIYERKGIFLQEGIHRKKTGFGGVVHNEMLGAFSEPEQVLDLKLSEELFKDTDGRFNSGGQPEHISELSYKQFLDFHRRYYHPSNSIIYIYGKNDMEKFLDFLDNDYLSRFEKRETEVKFKLQKTTETPKDVIIDYERDESIIVVKLITGLSEDYIGCAAASVLCDALFNCEASPVKKAVGGICSNIYAYTDEDMYQSTAIITLKDCRTDLGGFKEVFYSSLKKAYENGIDERLLKGCIFGERFYFLDGDFGYKPKGLFYNLRLLQGFAHTEESFENLKFNKIYDSVERINFKSLIKKLFLDNKSCVFGIMKKGEKIENAVIPKSAADTDEKELFEYQKIKDKQEDIEKIPRITIDEVGKDVFMPQWDVLERNIIFNPLKDRSIAYLNLVVDIKNVPAEIRGYLGIFRYLLGRMATSGYSADELNTEINYYLGSFRIYFSSYYLSADGSDYMSCLNFSVKTLNENRGSIFRILGEVIFKTSFEDNLRIEEKLRELKSELEENFISNTGPCGTLRCLSYFDPLSRTREEVSGIKFYHFLCSVIDAGKYDELKQILYSLAAMLFRKENVTINIGCNPYVYGDIAKDYNVFYENLFDNEIKYPKVLFKENINSETSEAFVLFQNSINSNSLAANYFESCPVYNGKIQVINRIVSSYLWYRVRGEGGAYGASFNIRRNGAMFFSSYMDPSIEFTYENCKAAGNYIKNIRLSREEIKNYIIGTVNELDRPVKDALIGEVCLFRYFSKIGEDELKREREEILLFKGENISEFKELFTDIAVRGYYCTIGNEAEIERAKKYFKTVKKLLR